MSDVWEEVSEWWQAAFTDGVDAEYTEQIEPLVDAALAGRERVLDIGTGEGQLARRLVSNGSEVVGVDPTWAQLTVARERGGGPTFVRSTAEGLPFADGSFDGALACLVFEHIAGVDAALDEVGRVLRPGGRFFFLLNHPLLQTPGSGWIDDHILCEQYWRIGPYLTEDTTLEEVDPGVVIPFVHRPLSRYVNAIVSAGMLIEGLDEPAPPPGFLARAEEYQAAATIPRLLAIRAVKQARDDGGVTAA